LATNSVEDSDVPQEAQGLPKDEVIIFVAAARCLNFFQCFFPCLNLFFFIKKQIIPLPCQKGTYMQLEHHLMGFLDWFINFYS